MLAIEHLHKNKIIYRDLKPENVVLDLEGNALLTDFGLAKIGVEGVNKGAKSFCGSVAYLAPEMLRKKGAPATAVTTGHGKSIDWYNLGVLIFEMFSGDPPFFDDTQEKIFENIKRGELEMPESMSEDAKDFVRKLMTRDPLERQKFIDNGEMKKHSWLRDIGGKLSNARLEGHSPEGHQHAAHPPQNRGVPQHPHVRGSLPDHVGLLLVRAQLEVRARF